MFLINRFSLKIFRQKKEVGPEAYTAVHFLFIFVQYARIHRVALEEYIPEVLLNELECLANKI